MNIFFSNSAQNDVVNTVKYISRDKPKAAKKWAIEIKRSIQNLSDFPRLGRIVPEFSDENIRELVKGQYRIVYKIDIETNTIAILAVHHSKKPLA
ncbi:type II toxin-antitoxin system RelE/ParE family toxin [candidate division KSB1 bacterium]|nr:type II toxin-antitoxin system RelE/ParE family toxin [candidate division KSB1 bacterium]